MPGAYAHITLVNIARETRRLEAIEGFPPQAILALQRHLPFCELGCVSTDYPYLAIASSQALAWADAMHYSNTGDRIKAGVVETAKLEGADRLKAFAWLAGYAAHMITDVTVHPVVELKVGPYAQNQMAHRVCEMNQDAYIYQRLGLGPIGMAEHLDSGIGTCNGPAGPGELDPLIAGLWRTMLVQTAPAALAESVADVDLW
ncbi:MAG TPA: zinc dependent phospholipase C family protein, partial [Burkholderiales bacterium]|nr:zinc dependent phospholipase C family protein [Burkholderiales bacterium]